MADSITQLLLFQAREGLRELTSGRSDYCFWAAACMHEERTSFQQDKNGSFFCGTQATDPTKGPGDIVIVLNALG